MTRFRRAAVCITLFSALLCLSFAGGFQTPLDTKDPTSISATRATPLATTAQQTFFLPPLSSAVLDGLMHQDASEAARRFQIGVARTFDQPIFVNGSRTPASSWTTLPNGWRVWSADVTSSGALGLRVHLESLTLPEGALVLIYDPEKPAPETVPITAQTLAGQRELWTETLFSQRVTVECQVPPGVDPAGVALSITAVSHIYLVPSSTSGDLKEGTCEKDVTCYPAWANEASGVARISFVDGGNTYLCSGCLLADSNGGTSGNYFLTAHHCILNSSIASTMEFFWFFQTSTCNGTPPDVTTVPHTSGASYLAGHAEGSVSGDGGSDFTFLRLKSSPPSGAAYLSWSTDPPPAGGTLTGIHHPTGAYKRICFGSPVGSDPDFWGVQWYSGVTEPGSSGSPLLNASHQVIGQLNGGFGGPGSSCNNPTAPDQYGRFDVTYAAIKKWLGGSGGGQTTFVKGTYTGLFQESAECPSKAQALLL